MGDGVTKILYSRNKHISVHWALCLKRVSLSIALWQGVLWQGVFYRFLNANIIISKLGSLAALRAASLPRIFKLGSN
jgi:hypothetical protein